MIKKNHTLKALLLILLAQIGNTQSMSLEDLAEDSYFFDQEIIQRKKECIKLQGDVYSALGFLSHSYKQRLQKIKQLKKEIVNLEKIKQQTKNQYWYEKNKKKKVKKQRQAKKLAQAIIANSCKHTTTQY